MKVAILFIATGRYTIFWKDFYNHCEKYFLPDCEKTYFLFTDDEKLKVKSNVVKVNQEQRGWPFDTLMRFDTFLKAEEKLKEMDYIYFLNATMLPVKKIGKEILPTQEQGLMVTLHPGLYKVDRSVYEYDTNPASNACISADEGRLYFMGGFNGGTSGAYLKLIKDLDFASKQDLEKGVIARWHDESHLNKYMLDKNPLILTPEYGFPEGMPFNQQNLIEFKNRVKMMIIDKSKPKYGGHDWLRGLTEKKITYVQCLVLDIKRVIVTLKRKIKNRLNKMLNFAKVEISQQYWDDAYEEVELKDISLDPALTKWLNGCVEVVPKGRCLEIGCFPGGYLDFWGKLGFELNGIDLTPRTKTDLPAWLESKNYRVGNFYVEDFMHFNVEEKFDLVYSLGLVEHFDNYEGVIKKHAQFVADQGYLIITTPNFEGFFQKLIHKFLDSENYKRHNIKAMNPKKWAKILKKQGFEIIYSGHVGRYDFWLERSSFSKTEKRVFNQLEKSKDFLRATLPENCRLYSPHCVLFAKKISKNNLTND